MKRENPKFQKILDAAVAVIAENGYHQAQVSKIARRAGVADGTIYLYFKSKEEILISLFQEKMGYFVEQIKEETDKTLSAVEKLNLLIRTPFELLSKNPELAIVTQLELRQSNKEIRRKINAVLRDYLEFIDDILQAGIQNGEFRSDLNVRLARQMIFGTIDETVTNWVMKEQKYDLVSLAEPVHGLLTAACGYSFLQPK